MNYWKRKEELAKKANDHTAQMAKEYADEIATAVQSTVLHRSTAMQPSDYFYPEKSGSQSVIKTDSVSALFLPELENKKVCVLNFASYKNPGGMFLKGSSAQEESLCHESFLYNVLKEYDTDRRQYYGENRSNMNKGMYRDVALYTPDVRFFHNGQTRLADVITCAAPNYMVAVKYKTFTEEENYKALNLRINFVKHLLAMHQPDVAILGAWGCGVFMQDPKKVATLWWQSGGVPVEKTIHAIPDRPTFEAFCEIESFFDFAKAYIEG